MFHAAGLHRNQERGYKAGRRDGLSCPASSQRRRPGEWLRAWKISKRRDQDISALCGAFSVVLEGQVIRRVRLAFGGMAATPKRATMTEQVLLGRPFNLDSLQAAREALARDFSPLTDGRATAEYRAAVAANLLTRLQADLLGQEASR